MTRSIKLELNQEFLNKYVKQRGAFYIDKYIDMGKIAIIANKYPKEIKTATIGGQIIYHIITSQNLKKP